VASRQRQIYDEPLFFSANFLALPSLGSMVEGWILVLPKEHFLSIGAMPAHLANEMMDFKARVAGYLAAKYGALCAFEHGPSSSNRQVGCGVDHAHLHLVPIGFDLILAARHFLPRNLSWSYADLDKCRSAFAQRLDYLYVEQPLGYGRIAVHHEFGSQVFRKAIASQLGMPDQYSWRDYPQLENITRTIESLRAAFALRVNNEAR
jgi:diadenosine tetraphosphate (Ap4A) HIT family hydrolase